MGSNIAWSNYSLSNILNGKKDGEKLLLIFLNDVVEKLGVHQPTASCMNCLRDYHERLIKKEMKKTESKKSQYKLLPKYDGIQLEFGSSVHVFNTNITDELAKKLIKRFESLKKNFTLDMLFSEYPIVEKKERKPRETKSKDKEIKDEQKEEGVPSIDTEQSED